MENVNFTVRLSGESARILNQLVNRGYSGSKTEAVRTALISYALKLGLLNGSELFDRTAKRVSAKGYNDEEVQAQIDLVKSK